MLPEKSGLRVRPRRHRVIFASAFPVRRVRIRHREVHDGPGQARAGAGPRGRAGPMNGAEPAAPRWNGASPSCATCWTSSASIDRRFIFRRLAMGDSQSPRYWRAGTEHPDQRRLRQHEPGRLAGRGLNRAGRCRRVVVVSADDVSSDVLLPWVGWLPGLRRRATEDVVADVATRSTSPPRHGRRHGRRGVRRGVGRAVRERGLQPICEVLAAVTANSAFHGPVWTSSTSARSWRPWSALPRLAASTAPSRPAHGVRVPRDLHTGPRWFGGRGDQRAAPGVRCRRRLHRDHQQPGLHRRRHGRRHRGRGGDQGTEQGSFRPCRTTRSRTPSLGA